MCCCFLWGKEWGEAITQWHPLSLVVWMLFGMPTTKDIASSKSGLVRKIVGTALEMMVTLEGSIWQIHWVCSREVNALLSNMDTPD